MIIEFNILNVSNEVKSHSHEYGQFVMPYSGAVHIEFDDKSNVIDENAIGYIPPRVSHKYNGERN